MKAKKYLISSIRWTLFSSSCGILAGAVTTVFLMSLDWITQTRIENPEFIWGLPVSGWIVGWIYHRFGKDIASGSTLILDEIHNPKKTLPLRMAPMVLFGTIMTHLFGGSAGREGTAVQMGASLSAQFFRIFKTEIEERNALLIAGMAAGFGAAIGTPWAGMIFGMEVVKFKRPRFLTLYGSLVASFVGFFTTVFLQAPHSLYPKIEIPDFEYLTLFSVMIAGALLGVTARGFMMSTHLVERAFTRRIPHPPLKAFLGGLAIAILFYIEGSYRYTGLGISLIQEAFQAPSEFKDPLLKSVFTSLTIGTGFKGGEFTPLAFIGATLGSALSTILPVSSGLLAALGFAAVFAGAAKTPLTCTLMAMELFGVEIGPFALIACFVSSYFSGSVGIYDPQRRRH